MRVDGLEFQRQLSTAATPAACTSLFKAAVAPYGVDGFAAGNLDVGTPERTVFFAIEWPEAWRTFYLGSELARRDPIIAALKRRTGPFTWGELLADPRTSAEDLRLVGLALAAGWADGLVVPVTHTVSRFGLVSLAATAPIGPDAKAELGFLSAWYYLCLRGLMRHEAFPVPPAALTGREAEVLQLVARGLSDRAIASQVGIAAATAHEHVERAKRKLRARTRGEAAGIAIALGILQA